jgi:hypothetical protein
LFIPLISNRAARFARGTVFQELRRAPRGVTPDFNVNSISAKNRSARGTIFRYLGRAKRGPNSEIQPTPSWR